MSETGKFVSNIPRPGHPEDVRIDPYLARTALHNRRHYVDPIIAELEAMTGPERLQRYTTDPEFRKRCERYRP